MFHSMINAYFEWRQLNQVIGKLFDWKAEVNPGDHSARGSTMGEISGLCKSDSVDNGR